jgi:outer membrane protein TolC
LYVLPAALASWGQIAAAQGGSPVPLTFAEAVDRAPTASTRREAAQAELDATTARRDEALTALGPKVHANYTQATFDRAVTVPFGAEAITLRPDDLRQGGLEVKQPLSGLFAAYELAAAAKSRQDASAANLDLERAAAAFDTAGAYLEAQEADELVRLAETSIAAFESQTRDAEALSRSGKIIRSDLLKISIAIQDAKAQLARATARQTKARERLLHLVGLPRGSAVTLEPLPKAAAAAKSIPSLLAAARNEAAPDRLEVKKAALDVAAAEHAVSLSKWKFAPSVDAFVKWDRIYSEPPFGNPEFTRSYGVTASWEIWDNGARIFAAREASALTRKSAAALREAKDQARLETDGLVADLLAAKEALAAAQAAVDQAEEAYRLDKARFTNGLVTATDLLLSEATRTKIKGAYVTTLAQLGRLALDLQRAGGATKPRMLSQ